MRGHGRSTWEPLLKNARVASAVADFDDVKAAARPPHSKSAQAGPVVGDQDRIGGIGGVVLDAGGLAGDEFVETHLALQAGDVLRGVIGDAGDGIAVGNELPWAQVGE